MPKHAEKKMTELLRNLCKMLDNLQDDAVNCLENKTS